MYSISMRARCSGTVTIRSPCGLMFRTYQRRPILRPARFTEKDDMEVRKRDPQEVQQRRRAEESVIRKQEEELAKQDGNGSPATPPDANIKTAPKPPPPAHLSALAASGYKVNPLIPAFTRRRELYAGRMAMVGFFMACFWEWYFPSHPNVFYQLAGFGQMMGLPLDPSQVALFFGGLILHNAVVALAPNSPTWSPENQKDVLLRPVGPPTKLVSPLDIKRFFGVTGWGFTKPNELFHGRLAMLGFTGVLLQQLRLGGLAGPGALAQVAYLLNVPADETFYAAVPTAFVAWAAFATALAYLSGRVGVQEGEGIV